MTAVEHSEKEMQRLGTYKDMAIRSLRYLHQHPKVGNNKLLEWLHLWVLSYQKEEEVEEITGVKVRYV